VVNHIERKAVRVSPTKNRQTMGKITRERERAERRALKLEKKEEKKLAAAAESAAGTENPLDDVPEA
jgi:hypothetical protein